MHHSTSQSITQTFESIKAHLKTLEDISRTVPTYSGAAAILSKLQKNMDQLQNEPSSAFPKLDIFDPQRTRHHILQRRPCKEFVRESNHVNAYEKIFTTLQQHMHDAIDEPLEALIANLRARAGIRDTRNPNFAEPLGRMDSVGKVMLDACYAFNGGSSRYYWMLGQDITKMLEDLRHYNCTGSFEADRVEKARRQVRAGEYVAMRIKEVMDEMRKADRV